MLVISNRAATILTQTAIITTARQANITPKFNASSGNTLPQAVGLVLVLSIIASISASYQLLILAAAPEPAAMAKMAIKAIIG